MKKKPLTKILYIDNETDILTIAKYSMESLQGVTVKYLTSGEAAIQEALEFHPDLILMNVMMTKMNGIAAFKTMKLLPSLATIPVVFVTAKAQKEELAYYLKLGILDVIIKPFDPLTLGATVQNIWDRYQES